MEPYEMRKCAVAFESDGYVHKFTSRKALLDFSATVKVRTFTKPMTAAMFLADALNRTAVTLVYLDGAERKEVQLLDKAGKPCPDLHAILPYFMSQDERQLWELLRAAVPINQRVQRIKIVGREWWRRGIGGTYNTVEIWVNDQHVAKLSQAGGSNMTEQRARDWLVTNKYLTPVNEHEPLWQMRDRLGFVLDCSKIDVARERNL
jgi:hypothetical protein